MSSRTEAVMRAEARAILKTNVKLVIENNQLKKQLNSNIIEADKVNRATLEVNDKLRLRIIKLEKATIVKDKVIKVLREEIEALGPDRRVTYDRSLMSVERVRK